MTDKKRNLFSFELPPELKRRMKSVLQPGEALAQFVRTAIINELKRREKENLK